MAVSFLYPLIGGGFALALTLATIPVMSTVALVGLATSWFIVRPRLLRAQSLGGARGFAGLVLALVGPIVAGAWLLYVFLTARTADGSPHWALLAPLALGLGVAVLSYWVAVALLTRTAVRPSRSG